MTGVFVTGNNSYVKAKLNGAVWKDDIERFRNENPTGSSIIMKLEGKLMPYEVTANYPFCCTLRNTETGKIFEKQWKEVYLKSKGYEYEG